MESSGMAPKTHWRVIGDGFEKLIGVIGGGFEKLIVTHRGTASIKMGRSKPSQGFSGCGIMKTAMREFVRAEQRVVFIKFVAPFFGVACFGRDSIF